MSADVRPMLASKADMGKLRFPLFASPKIDGVRAIVSAGVVYSRTGKPIPNAHVQALYGGQESPYEGLDGELAVGYVGAPDCFKRTQSGVMRRTGEPEVRFFIFDSIKRRDYYSEWMPRMRQAITAFGSPFRWLNAGFVDTQKVYNLKELEAYEERCLFLGFEGVMLRVPLSFYEHKRSKSLLKLKRFEDAEAEVLNTFSLVSMRGVIHPDFVGALHVRDVKSGVEFSIGTGFSHAERAEAWKAGDFVRYRHLPGGSTERPRSPVFIGRRAREDF